MLLVIIFPFKDKKPHIAAMNKSPKVQLNSLNTSHSAYRLGVRLGCYFNYSFPDELSERATAGIGFNFERLNRT